MSELLSQRSNSATSGELLITYDNPSDPLLRESDGFGISVALDGNRVLVGETAGQAYVFDYEPVPEPSTGVLMLVGAVALFRLRKAASRI